MKKYNITLILFLALLVIISLILHQYLKSMEWKDILMTNAVIIGPIFAVIITRKLDDERFTKDRKLGIFRALVKDRSNPISYDFVNALNSTQIEFSDDKNVIEAWKALLECRNSAGPAKNDEDGWARKNAEASRKTDQLIHAMAKVLNINVNPFDIQESYIPVGWGNEQQTISKIKSLLIEILENKRSVHVNIDSKKPESTNIANEPNHNKNPRS